MFNNAAFDVVLGMALIYLLYSLLVTIVGEMLATWMALRSRILRVAIEKMLNDGYFDADGKKRYSNWWHFLQRFFLREFKGFKDSFAGKFYTQASVKYLSGKANDKNTFFSQTKPSYISDANFANTLTAMLTEKGTGQTVMEKINYCLTHNICHIQPQTLAYVQRLYADANNDVEQFKTKLKAWFNETNDRATGWYKRKLQLILFWLGFVIAVAFNVDSIRIARFLAKDEDARKNLATMAIAQANDSLRYAGFYTNNGDTLHSKTALDSGLAMAQKDIKEANLILGLGWGLDTLTKDCKLCFSAKCDSAQYYSLLRNNTLLNDTITSFNKLNASVLNLRKKLAKGKEKIEGVLAFVNNITAQKVMADTVKKLSDSLPVEQRNYLADSLALAQQQDSLINIDTLISGVFTRLHQLTNRELMSISKIDSSKAGKLVVYGKCTYSTLDKIGYVICQLPRSGTRLLGFIITALMLSLGAPFWFDLLKKLVSLRGSGVKPEEKKPTGDGQQPNPADNQIMPRFAAQTPTAATTVNEQALDSITKKLANEPGVVAIGLKPDPNNAAQMAVEIMVKDAATAARLQQLVGNTATVTDGTALNIIYTIAATNVFHGAMIGSEVGNQAKVLGQGTLGCFLQKDGDPCKYLLSCWHVLKDNTQWTAAPLQKNIIQGNNVIGALVDGCLTNTIDVSIANYTPITIDNNLQITITGQQREVVAFDSAVSTPVKLYGKVCGFKEAVIIHHKINAQLKYPDQLFHNMSDLFSIAVVDSATEQLTAPTSSGDSGAVVTDMDGVPLGMIIGGNDILSYAVKFTNIMGPSQPYAEYSFIVNPS